MDFSSENVDHLQKNWVDRELVSMVQLNVMRIIAFLDEFDTNARNKISLLNQKLRRLEVSIEQCESRVSSKSH